MNEPVKVQVRAQYPGAPSSVAARAALDAEIAGLKAAALADPKGHYTKDNGDRAKANIAWAKDYEQQ